MNSWLGAKMLKQNLDSLLEQEGKGVQHRILMDLKLPELSMNKTAKKQKKTKYISTLP